MTTHDAAVAWATEALGVTPVAEARGTHQAVDAQGKRYRICGRIDPDDRHVDLGRDPAGYDWLIVVRFAGVTDIVHNAWKIPVHVAEAKADPNRVLRLTNRFLGSLSGDSVRVVFGRR